MRVPVDLQHLRAFVAIAREGNLTRAAVRLHLTQPAVSMQVKSLQEMLKLTLFTRTARGLALSPQGRALLPVAERILLGLEDFSQMADGMQHAAIGRLSIGTIMNPETIRLGACLHYLAERYPQVQTRLRHGMSGWQLEQVRNGEMDSAFYLCPQPGAAAAPELDCLRLTTMHYFVIAPKGWQARVQNQSWAQVAALPWIWTPEHSTHHQLLSRQFGAAGVQPNVVAEVDLEASMLDLVISGVGLSLARDSVALQAAQTHGLVVASQLVLQGELQFIAQARRAEDPLIRAAFAAVRATYA